MTALQIIEAALRKIGAIGQGRATTAGEAADALLDLNSMIAEWSADDLVVPFRTREELTLTAGTNPHTIGSGGTLNTAQPMDIHSMVVVSSGSDYPLGSMQLDDYDAIPDKTTQSLPARYYFERGATLGRIYFDWVPAEAYTLRLTSLKPVTGFAALTTEDSFPDEYDTALVFNLAVRLAPEYPGREAPDTVKRIAATALRALERNNAAARIPVLSFPSELMPGGRTFDIDTGVG